MPASKNNPDIETGADTLLSFLEEKTKWPASKIADDLGVPEETVKKWAKALEKSGLVDIKYSAIKGMVLEYSSDKSYDELNKGRSELALETDEIEIEAEEVEEVEEEIDQEEISETVHDESETENANQEDEESEDQEDETEETKENKDEGEEDSEEEEEDRERTRSFDSDDDIKRKGFEKAEINKKDDEDGKKLENDIEKDEESEEDDISKEEGKQKLKDELEKLENQKNSNNDEKQKVKAKKAKIKKDKKKVKKNKKKEKNNKEEVSSEQEKDIDEMHKKVKKKSSSQSVEHEKGETFQEHLENLKELGDLLRDVSVDNSDVYSRMEIEMGALKNTLEDKEITDKMKKEVSNTMVEVEEDIKNEETPPGPLEKIKNIFKR